MFVSQKPRSTAFSVTQTAGGVVAAAAMIATPLARRGGDGRRRLAAAVVGGLATTTVTAAARRWGAVRAVTASATVGAITTVIEHVGLRTGRPFGRYRYSRVLRPQIAGVPVVVPLAWAALSLPARESVHAALGGRGGAAGRIGLGAAALTAWDLFLDPQMVGEGYWTWPGGGRYRGIPVSNLGGWLVTGAAVMTVLETVLPARRPDPVLVGEYAAMAVMETLAYAAFFRDRVVALVGGAAMLPIAALALAGTRADVSIWARIVPTVEKIGAQKWRGEGSCPDRARAGRGRA